MYCKKRKILTKRKKKEILVVVRSSFAHPSLIVRSRFVYGRAEKNERNETGGTSGTGGRNEKAVRAVKAGRMEMIGK